jgi:hypothetical protein
MQREFFGVCGFTDLTTKGDNDMATVINEVDGKLDEA